MKNWMRFTVLPLLAVLFLCLFAAPAAAEEGWNTDYTALQLLGNQRANYVLGVGDTEDPAYSFLFANDAGGVTIVQSVLKPDKSNRDEGLIAAEFDGELNFLRFRTLALPELTEWCGFLAGTDYYYVFYAVSGSDLRIDQYTKDWTLKNYRVHSFSNTMSFPHNDFDVCQAGDRIVIVTNHTMSSGSAWGHEANLRLELDAETLAAKVEQSGTATYKGYVSHSFLPEVVYNDGVIYTVDRSDGIPKTGVVLTVFKNSLSDSRSYSLFGPQNFTKWQNWGNLGNAIPAGGGMLLTCNEGVYVLNDPLGPAGCNAYLYYGNALTGESDSRQISFAGTVATPMVAAIDENHGYVLWNPEIRSDRDGDELDYIPWSITDGELSVGELRTETKTCVSDCVPISWNGGILWFVVDSHGELHFYTIGEDGSLGQKFFHSHYWSAVSTRQATCTEAGERQLQCPGCGEETTEVIPPLGHNMTFYAGRPAACGVKGKRDYYSCIRCSKYFADEAGEEELTDLTIPALEHEWETVIEQTGDCVTLTDEIRVKTCALCGKVQRETIYAKNFHQMEHVDAQEPTCEEAGWYEHYRCTVCHRMYADEGGNQEWYYVGKLALGHDMVFVERQEPTALADGHIEHYRCSRCGEPFRDRYGNEPLTEAEIRLPALGSFADLDFDGDGDVDADDAAAILRAVSRGTVRPDMDLSGDGVVSNRDGLRLFRMLPLPQ